MSPKLGVMFRRERPIETLPDFARRIEELGFDELWVVEDCFYHGGIAQAAMALASTQHIKIGLGIAPAVARNSAFTAMEFATLATGYPDRFVAGIGHGVDIWMQQIGEKPASWMKSMREIVTDIQTILAGHKVTTTGEYSALTDVVLEVTPRQRPPLLLGVRGPKSIQLAGEISDGVLLAEVAGADYIRWAHNQMAIGAAGRDVKPEVYVYANTRVSNTNPESAIADMRDWMAEWHPEPGSPAPVNLAQLPYIDELMETWTAGKPWKDEWLMDSNICGTTDDARQTITRMGEAGAHSVIFTPHPKFDIDEWIEQVAPLANRG